MINMYNTIIQAIKKAPSITVFRHINPDHDALGSQYGLITWIRETYPDKEVYACGFHSTVKGIVYPDVMEISDEVIEESLAIVLDSANQVRIDDQRFSIARTLIKIDHHPLVDDYGDIKWVNSEMSSTCEMISTMLQVITHQPVSYEVARYLLAGMMSDTIMFSIRSTTSDTLKMAGYLLESGVSINELHQRLFTTSLKEYHFINFIKNKAKVFNGTILAAFITHDELVEYGMHPNLAKEYVYALANISEIEVWALFIEIEVDGVWLFNGSLRSKRATINTIAAQYNGGGHKLAAAVKHVSLKDAQNILELAYQATQED
jgi:phosphoesterase RecJ-like protein